MFYAHFVLAKKGPLARIWLAAHWDKKLTKAHVFETNIEKSVDGILQPKVKMALRTSGHLLLGVVRIYSRKAKYLLADCNEAFVKIKMAFRPGMVDLPEEHREAAVNAITLPEVFHDFDTTMPELNDVDIEAQFSLNQSRAEEITMREDYGNISLVNSGADDGFGDMGFDSEGPDIMRHGSLEPSIEQSNMLFCEPIGLGEKDSEPIPSTSGTQAHDTSMEIEGVRDDGFGANLDNNIISGGLFEGGLFDDAPMGDVPASIPEPTPQDIPPPESDDDDDMDHFGGPPSVGGVSSGGESRPASTVPPVAPIQTPTPSIPEPAQEAPLEEPPQADQTTLLHNEDESFALAPVDASQLKGLTKTRKKRKLIVDEVKNISGEEMKNQLSDTSDIVTTLDLAPPTKRLMHWKETGGVEKLFALPARNIPARVLFKSYQRHLTIRSIGTEDFAMLGDMDSLAIDQIRDHDDIQHTIEPPAPTRRGRKRKIVEEPSRTPMYQPEEPPHPPMYHPEQESMMPPTPVLPLQPQTPIPPMTPMMGMSGQEDMGHQDIMAPPTPSMMVPTPGPSSMLPPGTPGPSFMTPGTPGPGILQGIMPSGPPGMLYTQTPGYPTPPTPLRHIEEMPHLAPEQVQSILQEQEQHVPAITPAHTEEDILSSAGISAQTPHHPGIEGQLPLEPLNNLQHDLPGMENMGYDQNQMANMGYDESARGHTPPAGGMSERVHSPWVGEYDYDVGPVSGEEQMVDETDEQFEERVLNKRAYQMFTVVRQKLNQADQLSFSEMCYKNFKKQAAQKFYSLLVLKKFHVLELEQDEPYGNIIVTKGPKFTNPVM